MADQIVVSTKIPQEWVERIRSTGMGKSEFVRSAIASALGIDTLQSTQSTPVDIVEWVKSLDERVSRLEQGSTTVDSKPPIEPPVAPIKPRPRASVPDGDGWMTQKQVCDRYNLSYSNFARYSEQHGSPEAYLLAATGERWEIRGEGRGKRLRICQL